MAFSKIIFNGTTLMDVTQDTVAADNLLAGETATGADGEQVTGAYVPSGGGGTEQTIEHGVLFIDYDGEIVEEWEQSTVASKTALPSNPSHTGLTAQGWNWSLSDIQSYIASYPSAVLTVGQMYITSSGATEIDIVLDSDTLHPYLGFAPNGTVVVDWGDGSATSTVTGTSLTSVKWADHTYSEVGKYTIKMTVSSGSFNFYNGTNNYYASVLSFKDAYTYSRLYATKIMAIRMGSNAGLGKAAFTCLFGLKTITMPSTLTSVGDYAFNSANGLKSLVIPTNVTSLPTYSVAYCYGILRLALPKGLSTINTYAFYQDQRLVNLSLPPSVTNVQSYAFYNAANLVNVTIPSGVTTIYSNAFDSSYLIRRIELPSTVSSIQASAFANCRSCIKLRFNRATPATVSNSNAWTNLGNWCIISVPTGSLSAYTSASNYPSSSTYTYIEEA